MTRNRLVQIIFNKDKINVCGPKNKRIYFRMIYDKIILENIENTVNEGSHVYTILH